MRITNKIVTNLAESNNISAIRKELEEITRKNLNLSQENETLKQERIFHQEQLQNRIEEIENQKRKN